MPESLDWSRWPNFSKSEFDCRCCGMADMDPAFLDKLQAIRDQLGPMTITSGYRCSQYNARISSTGNFGPHTTGMAADISCSGPKAHKLIRLAMEHDITGIGVKQSGPWEGRFIHLDIIGGGKRPWIWSYR